ncbi:MAG TPA: hypothetical protein VD884_20365 [Ohtaekwangia sp.]|nr:hypothetical protein [Ohtaekwangia sp.]
MSLNYFIFGVTLILTASCTGKDSISLSENTTQIETLSHKLTEAETTDDVETFLAVYDSNAISMPEYQITLSGTAEIESYYREIFRRQNIKTFQRNAEEYIDLGNTLIEIGTFKKTYIDSATDTLLNQEGKYWNVWNLDSGGSLKLKGEAFGFFHPIEAPQRLVVDIEAASLNRYKAYSNQKVPFELKAYNALMEKGVRIRDGALRSEFFTEDSRFMPFAEPTLTGMKEIKPYLTAYSNRGSVTIDSIACYTYHHESFDDYLLEYAKFKVKWIVPGYEGTTEGKGIRIWKRQPDKSLKLYREIGTHDHIL